MLTSVLHSIDRDGNPLARLPVCRNLTCLNPRCALCCQSPNKRCPDSVNFASKYLEKNPLKSKCGASIRIEVVNAATGELAHPQLLQDVQLEVMSETVALPVAQIDCIIYCQCTDCVAMLQLSMMDGKKFAALHETGEDMASCELFLTPKVTLHTTSLSTALHSNLQPFVSITSTRWPKEPCRSCTVLSRS